MDAIKDKLKSKRDSQQQTKESKSDEKQEKKSTKQEKTSVKEEKEKRPSEQKDKKKSSDDQKKRKSVQEEKQEKAAEQKDKKKSLLKEQDEQKKRKSVKDEKQENASEQKKSINKQQEDQKKKDEITKDAIGRSVSQQKQRHEITNQDNKDVEMAGQKKEGTFRRLSNQLQEKLLGRQQKALMMDRLRQDEICHDQLMDKIDPCKHDDPMPNETTYVGPMKLILLTNPSDEFYAYTVCVSCWVFLCHLLIGCTVFLTVKPILMKVLVTNYSITTLDWHIILCTIGLLIAESILCLNHYNGCSPPLNPFHRKRAHWIIQIFGFVSALVGIIIIEIGHDFDLNRFSKKPPTLHDVIGFVSILLAASCFLNGVCALYSERLGTFGMLCKAIHNFIGIPAFILSTVAFCSGIMLRQYLYHTEIYITTTINYEITTIVNANSTDVATTLLPITTTFDANMTGKGDTFPTTTEIPKLNDLSNVVPVVLIVFSSIYTIGIVLMPFIKFFNCWTRAVMY